MASTDPSTFPTYGDLMYPVLVAVAELGGSAKGSEITAQVVDNLGFSEEQMAVTYEGNPKSILGDRIAWARSYTKLGGALESPKRAVFLLTGDGKEILNLSEHAARGRLQELERTVRAERARSTRKPIGVATSSESEEIDDEPDDGSGNWRDVLLRRLHRLSPEGFEEFVLYLLRTYGLELTRVGGSGDEGIDGIGLAPISDVLSSRVAVQAKRWDPSRPAIGSEVVALFQRDAAAAGAERAVLVTLTRFSPAAKKAAIAARPTVDLIDGDRLCELVEKQGIGVQSVLRVDETWFDRFDT